MRSRRIAIAASVLAVTLTAAAAGVMTFKPSMAGHAAGYVARQVHFSGGHGGFAGRGHGHRHGAAFLCSDRRDDGIARFTGFVEGFAEFTPPQAEAWARLTKQVRAESAAIGAACEEQGAAEGADTAPEHLARIEAMMAAGLQSLQRIRPVFADFYATLSDKQKQAIEDLIAGRGHRS